MSDLSPVSGSEIPTMMSAPVVGVVLLDWVPSPHEVTAMAMTVSAKGALVHRRLLIGFLLQKTRKNRAQPACSLPTTLSSPLVRTNVCANVTMASPPVKRNLGPGWTNLTGSGIQRGRQ